MIKSILLYDNEDNTLGNFFSLCAKTFHYLSSNHSVDNLIVEHKSSSSSKSDVEITISRYNTDNFRFVSFLHGDHEATYVSKNRIISTDNSYYFSNAFCYTFSCYCGNTLAQRMLFNSAHVFWGYREKAYSIVGMEDDFMRLSMSGLNHFFEKDTIETAFCKVKEEFTEIIDSLYKKNYFVASTLLHNKDSMVVHGKKDLSILDFV